MMLRRRHREIAEEVGEVEPKPKTTPKKTPAKKTTTTKATKEEATNSDGK